jgi:hypothetical protein
MFPTPLFLQFGSYVGVPAVALMFTALVLARQSSTAFVFFALLTAMPLASLVVVYGTGLWYVVWYHALVAFVGVVAMAGYGWDAVLRRAPKWLAACTGLAAVGASLVILVLYFTTAHGDRPRWREASELVRLRLADTPMPDIDVVGDVPGVVAHYLGVPPGQTMGNPRVHGPAWPSGPGVKRETWFVLESNRVPFDSRKWLSDNCELRGTFPARLVVRDRTVAVYSCLSR